MSASVPKWRIIFYDMLHPKEPRCSAEVQFTNKRICIFTKHKRYHWYDVPLMLYHEIFHIIIRGIFKEEKRSNYFDDVFDVLEYKVTKQIARKRVVKEKGWAYFNKTRHPTQLGVRPHD